MSLQRSHSRGPGGMRKIESAKNPKNAILRLFRYFLPFRKTLVFIFFLVLINTLTTITGPYLIGYAIDQYINKSDINGLIHISLLMLAVYLINWGSEAGSGVLTANLSQKALKGIRKDLFEHLQTLSIRFFDRNPHGELMSRLTNDIDAINQAVSQNITQLLGSVFTIIGVVVAMLLLNPWLTLVTMVAIPTMMFLVTKIARLTRKSFRELQKEIGRLNGLMEENVTGLREVKIFQHFEPTMQMFNNQNEKVCTIGIKAQTWSLVLMPLMTVLSNLNIVLIASIGGWMAIQGHATIGNIASFITYTRTFTHPLRQIGNLFNTIQAALAGAERIFEIIDLQPEIQNKPGAYALENIKGDVLFKQVSFRYKADIPVIKNMSLHARPGETIALVGPTGAGKTTIVNLLTRFYDIDQGNIYIDGRDIRDFKQSTLRKQLGIVLQDAFLFSDSVIENIRYGRLNASDEDCFQAARLANAEQFIQRLPQGYQTLLSERGSNLSQGQRQLLTIARAVLANPAILVLDEATSSVDTRTEIRIQQALLRLLEGRTSFVIAHRLSTIQNADQVLVINDGEIIERGTHHELLAIGGFYNNLYYSQFKGKLKPNYTET